MGIKVSRCVILCAAPVNDYSFLAKEILPSDYLICADGGMKHAREIGREPQLWVGDFDSIPFESSAVETLRHPPEKDDTDTMLAVKEGISRGYRDFVLLAATGGRLDHTIANLMILDYLKKQGLHGVIKDEKNSLLIIHNETISLSRMDGWKFSVFPWGGDATGITIRHAVYNVENFTMQCSYPSGVSNEFAQGPAEIGAAQGTLLICLSKD